ncbi:alpha/beta fold hydrolase [Aestuariirhabdus litorea]|uniref:Alpha/beta hydrolase n=1 Tax=Aestuariirhabdus litorea TaxID=2528527 RepID=A0A3P3VNN3_9GAMM|nr:alpha/beta hydrolase [Aestuariirhabdus litorea]RRJ83319.1 alpha/beta hydrolase [Aestuariirhabdus litorea]RWW93479.1 alpha/beta hydrolase [Endozoicomonadaceae bacterium GTF-13]
MKRTTGFPPLPSAPAAARWNLHQTPEGFNYYISLPPRVEPHTGLLVSVHGISRNAREHLALLADSPLGVGRVILCPLFSEHQFPGYQRLGLGSRSKPLRPDLALHRMLEHAALIYGINSLRFDLFGFSGGAQFAHRYALLHPHRLGRLALASAGCYTFPDHQQDFPLGLGQGRRQPPLQWLLEARLCIPTAVFVGALDNQRDESLRKGQRIDAQQGRHRIERGQRWVSATRRAIAVRGLTTPTTFTLLAGCGHDFSQCVTIGRLDEELLSFLSRPLNPGVLAPASTTSSREVLQFMG